MASYRVPAFSWVGRKDVQITGRSSSSTKWQRFWSSELMQCARRLAQQQAGYR